jgi:general secretion pathway protein G
VRNLWAINEAVNLYRHDLNALPATEAGLGALVNDADPDAGYLSRMPIDPWGNDYVYQRVGKGFRVISYGADGAPGGEGMNADIELRDGDFTE